MRFNNIKHAKCRRSTTFKRGHLLSGRLGETNYATELLVAETFMRREDYAPELKKN